MKSMTGYAKASCIFGSRRLNIELKTLNSKQLDLIVKLPAFLREREIEIRSMLSALERGKVECIIAEESATAGIGFNAELLKQRYQALASLAADWHAPDQGLFAALIQQGDVWASTDEQALSDEQWSQFSTALQQAIEQCDTFRKHEGSVLESDFVLHVDRIEAMLKQIPPFEQERIATAKERIRRWMAEADVREVDENRFEQELIYYLEKLDITEEKVRLQKHIDYFRQTMATEPTCGKKLGFVAQEMGREINTTGSKANHVEIQQLVVQMKDELEKIKEQLGNVL